MKIICIPVGTLQANCYIVINKNKQAILIDPGAEEEKIDREIKKYRLVGILLTHHHFDHIGALSYFEEKYHLKHNTNIKEFFCEMIPTIGHSKDSLTFYFQKEKIMFTGDFLFRGTIGRMDLPGGSEIDMQKSLKNILKYPNEIRIYPGHGPSTTLGEEKENFKYYF